MSGFYKKNKNMEKSDTVDRKYVEVLDIDDYEVLTDQGFKDIISVNKTQKYEIWKLKTQTHMLECADDHIVFRKNFEEVFVKDLKIGDMIITDTGAETVLEVTRTTETDNMYDLSLAEESDKRFYTNGILSHNSTIYCIYSLWLATFFPEKKIMLLANKAATALELLGRIEMAYEYLPKWLKSACLVYNKGELTFSNMSSIRAFASSSDAARGFSANCVSGDSVIDVRLFGCNFLKFRISMQKLEKLIYWINKVFIWRR